MSFIFERHSIFFKIKYFSAPYPTTATFRPHSARIVILKQCRQFSDDVQFNQTFDYPLNPTIYRMSRSFLVIQLIVAVKDEDISALWACDTSPEVDQMFITVSSLIHLKLVQSTTMAQRERGFSFILCIGNFLWLAGAKFCGSIELREIIAVGFCRLTNYFSLIFKGDGMFRIVPKVKPYAYIFSSKMDFKGQQLPAFAGNLTFSLPVKREMPSIYTIKIQLRYGRITDYNHEGIVLRY